MKSLPFILLLLFLAPPDEARRANKAYESGDYRAAEAGYRKALEAAPDDARLHFNLGNALARQNKHDEALAAFDRARNLATTPADRAAADYNIGHVLGAKNEWAKAAERFRSALRANPTDEQATYNYELAQRMLTNPPPQPQGGDQNQDPNDQDQQEGGSSSPQNPNPQQQQQDSGAQQGGQAQDGAMTREEANQILNALENKEKDLLKEFQKQQVPPRARHAKDW
jgi:Ca-activated chloride channel family protein